MADSLSTVSGVASGIDWKSLVDQIITLESRPATRMQSAITANTQRKDALEQLRTALKAVGSASDALEDGSAFDAFSTSAAGTDASGRIVASAVGGAGASPGTYSVQVTQLAQSQKTVGSVTFGSTTTALGVTGRLVVGGQNVDVTSTDTLAGVRDKINRVSGTSHVQATLLAANADGTGQRLVLTGTKTGAAAAFTAADDPSNATSLVAALGVGGTPQVAAADAHFTIDGTVTVARSSNSISDAIPGVTLSLAAIGTSTISIVRQDGAGASAVQTFVDAYNKLQSAVSQTTATTGALAHDAMARSIQSTLAQTVLGPAGSSAAPDLSRLSALGIAVQKDGTLTFDATAWQQVYPSRLADVKALLADRMDAVSTFTTAQTRTIIGGIDRRETAINDQSVSLQRRVDDITARLDKRRTALLAQYARSESLLGRLKSVGDSLTSQISGLNAKSSS